MFELVQSAPDFRRSYAAIVGVANDKFTALTSFLVSQGYNKASYDTMINDLFGHERIALGHPIPKRPRRLFFERDEGHQISQGIGIIAVNRGLDTDNPSLDTDAIILAGFNEYFPRTRQGQPYRSGTVGVATLTALDTFVREGGGGMTQFFEQRQLCERILTASAKKANARSTLAL